MNYLEVSRLIKGKVAKFLIKILQFGLFWLKCIFAILDVFPLKTEIGKIGSVRDQKSFIMAQTISPPIWRLFKIRTFILLNILI
jgi:hypothetical protein